LAFPLPADAQTPTAAFNEQVLHLAGDPDRKVDLVVTLLSPAEHGKFPLAVFNHSATEAGGEPAKAERLRASYVADYFLSRGYAVALPMMRGYAGSGGAQTPHKCEASEIALENGRDIAGVIDALAGSPRVDVSRVVVAGQGFGGWNTLGVGAVMPPDGVRGLVNFFGGIKSGDCNERIGGETAGLEEGARRLGANTALPSIWFYGSNDSLFDDSVWRTMHDVYRRAGGKALLVDVGQFQGDSRQMLKYPEAIGRWAPELDGFLRRIGLPSAERFPAYLPLAWPKPARFAKIDDVASVPFMGAPGRAQYQAFLKLPFPRAFVVSPAGVGAQANGGFDPLGRALALCRDKGETCAPYAVDDQVVWNGGTVGSAESAAAADAPAATAFAPLDDVDAVPWVNDQGRDGYRRYLSLPTPKVFAIATGGQAITTQGGEDPVARAKALCAKQDLECRIYAVDKKVVWVQPAEPVLPPASNFAKLDDVAAIPFIGARARETYSHFLTLPYPRAFVISSGGQSVASQGGFDPLSRALKLCKRNGLVCRPYAVDDRVVWVGGGK
jgi:dienelactone hydrolase